MTTISVLVGTSKDAFFLETDGTRKDWASDGTTEDPR